MDGLRLRDKHFNPRSPHGERLVALVLRRLRLAFQSTLPARGATRRQGVCHERDAISIHAPRTGSDVREVGELGRHQHFNPRSPHGERPTSSHSSLGIRPNFNPRSPHGERRNVNLQRAAILDISIHAPRTGSDWFRGLRLPRSQDFNPRSPHGERLTGINKPDARVHNFNPRSPHGERPRAQRWNRLVEIFQSTLPARGATRKLQQVRKDDCISIHAPRTGSDFPLPARCQTQTISIHAPRTGSDDAVPQLFRFRRISIHAPRTGSDSTYAGMGLPS